METKIENYQYEIISGDRLIVAVSNTEITSNIEKMQTGKDFLEKFVVNYNSGGKLVDGKDIVEHGMKINMSFETETYERINKTIDISLSLSENKNV